MPDVTISYKGSQIASMDASGTKTLLTEGKYCEDDIVVQYTRYSPTVYNGAHHSVVTVVITFTIDGITYSADSGMTWTQWCASAYNTDGFVCSNGYVIDSMEMMAVEYNVVYVSSSETIVENRSYGTAPYGLM